MKKWQIWVLWLIVGQAINTYKKDKTLQKKVSTEPGILGKAKLIWESRLQDNKEIFEEIKKTDWDKTIDAVEQDIAYDSEKIKKRWTEVSEKDWETTWHDTIRNVISKMPDKKTLADWVEKYKQRIVKWWDTL